MAKNTQPKTEKLTAPGFVKSSEKGVYLAVKVQPRASKIEVGEAIGEELKIRVTAPPVNSAANDAVLRLLAQLLGCPRSSIEVVRGSTSRHKQILIRGLSPEQILARLV